MAVATALAPDRLRRLAKARLVPTVKPLSTESPALKIASEATVSAALKATALVTVKAALSATTLAKVAPALKVARLVTCSVDEAASPDATPRVPDTVADPATWSGPERVARDVIRNVLEPTRPEAMVTVLLAVKAPVAPAVDPA